MHHFRPILSMCSYVNKFMYTHFNWGRNTPGLHNADINEVTANICLKCMLTLTMNSYLLPLPIILSCERYLLTSVQTIPSL